MYTNNNQLLLVLKQMEINILNWLLVDIYGMDDDAKDFKNSPDFFVKSIKILDNNLKIAALAI